jgi:ankyrin repeat protein
MVEPDNAARALGQPQMSAQRSDTASSMQMREAELAIFRAVRAGDVAALRVAITRGGNVNAKDERGRTPLQIARERADVETIKVLEAAGAR